MASATQLLSRLWSGFGTPKSARHVTKVLAVLRAEIPRRDPFVTNESVNHYRSLTISWVEMCSNTSLPACLYPKSRLRPRIASARKVKWNSPPVRFVIALHSLDGIAEKPDCCSAIRRSKEEKPAFGGWPATFSGLSARVAEMRRLAAILRGMRPGFSATQTAWRSEQNSNSQYNTGASR
jgi:hypothetical protein